MLLWGVIAGLLAGAWFFLLGMGVPLWPRQLKGSKYAAVAGLLCIIVTAWVMTPAKPKSDAAQVAARHLRANLVLPMEQQDGMTLMDITAEDETLIYEYRMDRDPEEARSAANMLAAQLTLNACSKKDYTEKLRQGMSIEIRYNDRNGKRISRAVIAPFMCGMK